MHCPRCQHNGSRVIDSRPADDGRAIRRRRECENCSFRFTTFERIEQSAILVVKKNGNREEFSREKLLRGIRRACEKRPVTAEDQENIVNKVERKIRDLGLSEVPSTKIGEYVMEELVDLDDVAYIRFASVYRQFKDIEVFMQEMKELEKKRKDKE
ncbi:transcriptional repressor NrdR [Alkalibacterium putridalgicola]|uniref:Transcriptional repressor NrdR n=1 Tax=Alkalibacterium putridalgicola TaxID=426703 RepID=A0A1H7SXB0_9LACT|nr:transcriptional regulator NrdR [Alkalibacterium putridalgicola]SEL77290.1 transcriptional repressor NrdR [Alkalibacterium putridalgicola]